MKSHASKEEEEHLSRSYNRHPESKKSKIKRETEEDWRKGELSNRKNTFLLL